MAYESLISAIEAVITANGNNEITGQILQDLLKNNVIPQVGSNLYKGVALTSTTPEVSPEKEIYYIAYQQGTYANFNGLVLKNGESAILLYNGTEWIKQPLGLGTKKAVERSTIQRNNSFEYNTLLSKYREHPLDYDTFSWSDGSTEVGVTPIIGNSPIWKTLTDGFISIPVNLDQQTSNFFGVVFECVALLNGDNFNTPNCVLQINGGYTSFVTVKARRVGNRFIYYGYFDLSTIPSGAAINLILALHAKNRPTTDWLVAELSNIRLFYIDDTEVDGVFTLSEHLDTSIGSKLDKVNSTNRNNPSTFRYGYFYFTGNSGTIQYNANNKYGVTDYIPVSPLGLVTVGAGQSAQGLTSHLVFDANKNRLRNVQNTDQYVYQAGDAYVVFVYLIRGNLQFAETVGVIEGTVYDFEKYSDYKPLLDLEKRVENIETISVEQVVNGEVSTYGNVENFSTSGVVIERNVEEDYLVYFKENTGNTWIYTPEFNPLGGNLVHIKFKVEFTRVGGHHAGLTLYVADQTSVGGFFAAIATIRDDGEYDVVFDPAYYEVYEGLTEFRVWINNQSMAAGQSLTAKLTNLRVEEYDNAVEGANIEGRTVKDLFESTDSAISGVKQLVSGSDLVLSPDGTKFEIGVTNAGALVVIPVIPQTAAFFGNSLIAGFGFGMAASRTDKDYYHLITSYITTLNGAFTATRNSGGGFESLTSSEAIEGVIQAAFLDVLTGNENLVVIQLGDNVNTPAKNAVFAESSLKLCQAVRNHCPNARVIWMGMWYGSTEKYTAIENACSSTGCTFVSLQDLISTSTRNEIGNLTERGTATRNLSNVSNVVENTPTNITVTFAVGGSSYETTLDVTSYSYNVDTLTYVGDFEIISSAGVASHPNDEGFRLIANKFLFNTGLSETEEQFN